LQGRITRREAKHRVWLFFYQRQDRVGGSHRKQIIGRKNSDIHEG